MSATHVDDSSTSAFVNPAVTVAGTTAYFNLAGRRLNKRLILSTVIGASIGFGIGLAAQAIFRYLTDHYSRHRRRPGRDGVDEMMHELSMVKSELSELHHLLLSSRQTGRRPIVVQSRETPPFYLSEDENDEFFDIEDGSQDNFLPDGMGPNGLSKDASFQSFTSGSKSVVSRLGPPLPTDVMEELDQLADTAMGISSPLTTSTPKLTPSLQVDSKPGSQAYARCLLYRQVYRRSPEFLWRFARATYLASEEATTEDDPSTTLIDDIDYNSDVNSISSRSYDPRNLNDLAYEARSRCQFVECGLAIARRALYYSSSAIRRDPGAFDALTLAEIYKWLAVMVGLASDFGGMQQRITYGFEFKQLIDKAIEFNPSDAHSRYMRGRWAYQVYNLSWVERQLASRLIATPPTATLEEAIDDFKEAECLQPNKYAAIHLFIAKCFLSISDYANAGLWLNKANQLVDQCRSPVNPHLDTVEVRREIEALLQKYSSYFP